jgi:hypothetical protein
VLNVAKYLSVDKASQPDRLESLCMYTHIINPLFTGKNKYVNTVDRVKIALN